MGLDRSDAEEVISSDRDLLTTSQCAALLKVSTDFILDEIKDGRIPAIIRETPNKPRMYRVTVTAFNEYAARHWPNFVRRASYAFPPDHGLTGC